MGRPSRGAPAGAPREALEPGSARAAAMDVVLLLQWTKCGADLPPFRDQPTDILSLEAALRPPRRDDLGRALASAAPRAPAHLGTGVGRTRFVSAQAVSALGQGQAGCAPRPREVQRLHLHGGTHPGLLEAARGASRTAQVGPAAAGAAKLRKRPWAIRKPKYWRVEHPGDLVEIDT